MHPAIRIVLERVTEHLSQQWTLSRAASLVGHNPSYLCWLFRCESGLNFHDWLEACRIDRGEQLLLETRKLISDVAAEVGYSECTFGRAFKRRKGVSPQTFRSRHRRQMVERFRAARMSTVEQLEYSPEPAGLSLPPAAD